MNYYNESDAKKCQWLTWLMYASLIPLGEIDVRPIQQVSAEDLRGFSQCHFFTGIGGWPLALQLASWEGPIWTGSCPCQPWSIAGLKYEEFDERNCWPDWKRLIGQCQPSVIVGEQVAKAPSWLSMVRSDLETLGYAVGAESIEAASVGAPHFRDRYYFVADSGRTRLQSSQCLRGDLPFGEKSNLWEPTSKRDFGTPWGDFRLSRGADGKCRVVKSGLRLLAHGISERVALLGGLGDAIVPQAAVAWLKAVDETLKEFT